jgi:hypothetical protein
MPRHSVEAWSTVTKIEAWPSPVMMEVRSVPHISSTRSVGLRAMRARDPAWRLESMRAGQAQDAPLGGADAGEAQSCPDSPVALTMERAVGQQLANRFHQGLVRYGPDRTRSPPGAWFVASAMTIQRGPRRAPDPGHLEDTIGSVPGGRDLAAHGLDLRRAKGRPASRCSIFTASNSFGHGQIPDLGLEAADLHVATIGGPGLQRRLASGQEGVAPGAQLGRRHSEVARHQLQILPA